MNEGLFSVKDVSAVGSFISLRVHFDLSVC